MLVINPVIRLDISLRQSPWRGGGHRQGVLMSHVDLKKCQCRMSLLLDISPVPC